MNEWALFYFWAAIMIALWAMAQHTPAPRIHDMRFHSMLRNFSNGFEKGNMGFTSPGEK